MHDFVAIMRRLADEGRRIDPGLKAFGACRHEWRFNPPARIEEVQALEHELNITLPEGLVRYLTQLGNGGCGPDYGIYSIDEIRRKSSWLPDNPDLPVLLSPEMNKSEWEEFVRGYDSIPYDENYDDAAARYLGRLTAGTVAVSAPGCTLQSLLICRGAYSGRIVTVDFDLRTNMPPLFCERFAQWCTGEVAAALSERK